MSDTRYLLLCQEDYNADSLEEIKKELERGDIQYFTLSEVDLDSTNLPSVLAQLKDRKTFNLLFLSKSQLKLFTTPGKKELRYFLNIIRKETYKPFYIREKPFEFYNTQDKDEINYIDFSLGVSDISSIEKDVFFYEFSLSSENIIDIIKDRSICALFRPLKSEKYDDLNEVEKYLRAFSIKSKKRSFRQFYMNLRYCLVDTKAKKRKIYRQKLEDTIFSFYLQKNITKDSYIKSLELFRDEVLSPTSEKEQKNMKEIIDFTRSEHSTILKDKVQDSIEKYNKTGVVQFYTDEDLKETSLIFFDLNYILSMYIKEKEERDAKKVEINAEKKF